MDDDRSSAREWITLDCREAWLVPRSDGGVWDCGQEFQSPTRFAVRWAWDNAIRVQPGRKSSRSPALKQVEGGTTNRDQITTLKCNLTVDFLFLGFPLKAQ